ncbi:MAG: CehA/McbA family metallohydrolase [Clostridia bacterium]|nr:CehA/McbA family metallohydrolase [Clostridia bacterium]
MKKELYSEKGNWYRINLHAHTTHSDGKLTPEQVKALYAEKGYDGVAFTDHRKLIPHTDMTDERFLALTATELDFSLTDAKGNLLKAVHLNAISPDPERRCQFEKYPFDLELAAQVVARLKEEGYFVILNHPVWSNMTNAEVEAIRGIDAMEIYNTISVVFNNYSDDSAHYENFLRGGGRALPIAADDCHRVWEDGTPFVEYAKSCVMVKSEALEYGSIFSALSRGQLYATTGPQIHGLSLEGDVLTVSCSPAFGVYVHSVSLGVKAQAVARDGESLTEVSLDLSALRACSPYFWVQIRDAQGEKAWTVPFYFNEL